MKTKIVVLTNACYGLIDAPRRWWKSLVRDTQQLGSRSCRHEPCLMTWHVRVETAPVRHVSFAETVEVVEFDPAVHAAPPPVIEYDTPAPNLAYWAHAAPAPMVEYDAAPTMAYRVYAAPAPVVEYDAPAARAAPSPLVNVPVVQVVQVSSGAGRGEDN